MGVQSADCKVQRVKRTKPNLKCQNRVSNAHFVAFDLGGIKDAAAVDPYFITVDSGSSIDSPGNDNMEIRSVVMAAARWKLE